MNIGDRVRIKKTSLTDRTGTINGILGNLWNVKLDLPIEWYDGFIEDMAFAEDFLEIIDHNKEWAALWDKS